MSGEVIRNVSDVHIVRVNESDFDIQHPLSERETMFLVDCPLHLWMKSLNGPPAKIGIYRVHQRPDDSWVFDLLDDNAGYRVG